MAEELVGLTRSYDVDVVGMFLVVLIPMYAVLYSALEASVNSIMYYILYISTLVVVIIVTRTTTKAGTDCNESPTTPLGHGTNGTLSGSDWLIIYMWFVVNDIILKVEDFDTVTISY